VKQETNVRIAKIVGEVVACVVVWSLAALFISGYLLLIFTHYRLTGLLLGAAGGFGLLWLNWRLK
jgi:hypothetical protein